MIGGIFFIANDTKVNTLPVRNYILVEVESTDGYPFPLALPIGKKAKDLVVLFQPNYHRIFRRANGKWLEINEDQRIYSDIQMKVT